jgi:endonuclease I
MRFSIFALLFLARICLAQIPAGYYNPAAGLSGNALKIALHNIIKNHTSISYNNLWTAYKKTDMKSNGKVWDMYSDIPSGTPPYQFDFVTDQCGNYSTEGDCYNREHSWPQSWFNQVNGPVSDLFHIYPTDGKVNGVRNNYPYGNVVTATWTSMNGGKLGPCSDAGYNQTVFEPIDAYKGDFARGYFYMSTRYYSEDSGWSGSDATNKATILPWEVNVLLQWHHQDPVSAKEIARNDSVYYKFQNNRNPYIDHPEWADSIWTITTFPTSLYEMELAKAFFIYPNPAADVFRIISGTTDTKQIHVTVKSMNGSTLYETNSVLDEFLEIDCSAWARGFYFISVTSEKGVSNLKFIKV